MGWKEDSLDWLRVGIREYQQGHLRIAVIGAHTAVAEALGGKLSERGVRIHPWEFRTALDEAQKAGLLDTAIIETLDRLRLDRNAAAHHPYTAPIGERVSSILEESELALSRLGVDVGMLSSLQLDGLYFKSNWPEQETIRLRKYCSDELGFEALCPIDWEFCMEQEARVDFATSKTGLVRGITFRRLSEKTGERKAGEWVPALIPGIAKREEVSSWIEEDTGGVLESDSHVLPMPGVPHLTKWSEVSLRGASYVGARGPGEAGRRFHGRYYELIVGSERLVIGVHQFLSGGGTYEMGEEIARSARIWSVGESPFGAPTVVEECVRPRVGSGESLEVGTARVRVGVDESGELTSDAVVRDGRDGRVKEVIVIEKRATIVRAKVLGWRPLERFGEEVRVYIPAEYVAGVHEWRQDIGSRTRILRLRDGVGGRLVEERVEF